MTPSSNRGSWLDYWLDGFEPEDSISPGELLFVFFFIFCFGFVLGAVVL